MTAPTTGTPITMGAGNDRNVPGKSITSLRRSFVERGGTTVVKSVNAAAATACAAFGDTIAHM
jgi:hypothetical protein